MIDNGNLNVSVLNISGQEIISLYDRKTGHGKVFMDWNGKDSAGKEVSPGLYLLRIITGGESNTIKLIKQ
jgi:flagellar hook assembly protein FlgD